MSARVYSAIGGSLALMAAMAADGSVQAAGKLRLVAAPPLQEDHQHFVMEADVNSHPSKLILDTGYYRTAFDLRAAGRLGISMSATGRDVYGVGGVYHEYRGTAARMRIGNLRADGMQVLGGDMWGEANPNGYDGRYGMNMMAAYDIDLDFAGGLVRFFQTSGDCGKPAVALAPELYTVPLEPIFEDRQADVMVKIDGHPVKAMLDSGAPMTTMYRSAAIRLGVDLSPLHAPNHATTIGAGKSPIAIMTHVFPTVAIGDLQFNNMRIRIVDQDSNGIDKVHLGSLLPDSVYDAPNQEQMLLGADFMKKVHLWISHSSQTLVMQFPPVASPR
jgi:predicted aspartyl protease